LAIEFQRTCAHGAVVHADYVRSQLVPLIETDVAELYESDPDRPGRMRLRAIESLPPHVTKAITRLKLDPMTGHPVEIVLGGKVEAANTLLRSLGEMGADANVSVGVNLGERLDRAVARVRSDGIDSRALVKPQPAAPINKSDLPMEI
jgi:hypothetical protein